MTKRSKPDHFKPIKDLREANDLLGVASAIKRSLGNIENTMNESIDQAKREAEADSHSLKQRLNEIEASLLAYAEYHKAELFKNKRSVELMHGSLGYRRSSEVKPAVKKRWLDVLDKIKNLGFTEAIRIKEDPNKDILREWPDEKLNLIDARRVEKDTFWYEVKEESVENAA